MKNNTLALILYPIVLFFEIGHKVGRGGLLFCQRLHVMFVLLELEFGVRHRLLLVLDYTFELFQFVVEAGQGGALFL
jgi:hypothetical protein